MLYLLSTIFECCEYNKVLFLLEINGNLDKEQHDIRPGRLTVTAGFEFIEKIIDSIIKGENLVEVFLLFRELLSVFHTSYCLIS